MAIRSTKIIIRYGCFHRFGVEPLRVRLSRLTVLIGQSADAWRDEISKSKKFLTATFAQLPLPVQ